MSQSALNEEQFPGEKGEKPPWYKDVLTDQGEVGNRQHITRNVRMLLPTHLIQHMGGVKGERPGEHRNMQDEHWEDFKENVRQHGVKSPVFITVDPGERPQMSEGNHRRDAAVAVGLKHIPAEVRYFGHAERETDLEHKANSWWHMQRELRQLES